MAAASTFLADLIYLIAQAGLGTYGTDVFKGSLAKLPTTGNGPWTSVIRTGGAGEEGTHNLTPIEVAYERPSAQIVARAVSYGVAEDQAQALYILLNFVNERVNGTWWRKCSPKQEPFDLGPDDVGRARVAFNIESVKRVSPATS